MMEAGYSSWWLLQFLFEYYAWRVISSVGFVLGGASLLWFAVKNKGSNNGKVNNP
jgi:hypothetical protein